MARRSKRAVGASRRMTVEEARKNLHSLVKEFRAVDEPHGSLFERAVEVGPYRRGGLVMVPELDARATEARIEELEDDLESIGIALLLEERRASAGPGSYQPVEELVRRLGLTELLAPQAAAGDETVSG